MAEEWKAEAEKKDERDSKNFKDCLVVPAVIKSALTVLVPAAVCDTASKSNKRMTY